MPKGGKRPGAGRKSKAEELKLAESMDKYCLPNDYWGLVFRLMKDGDFQAMKLWASYRFGMPQQAIDLQSNGISEVVFKWEDESDID